MEKRLSALFCAVVIVVTFAIPSYALENSPGDSRSSAAMMMPMMGMPMGQMMFTFGPTAGPVMGSGPQDSMPIGVGTVAMGGTMLSVHTQLGQFQFPMDMYFALYAPSIDPFNIYMMNQQGELQPASMGMAAWMTGQTSIDMMPFGTAGIPTSGLPKGTYYLGLMATPSGGSMANYYLWMTTFTVH